MTSVLPKLSGFYPPFRSVAALLLLIFYIAGPTQYELIHQVVHSDSSIVTHSEDQEQDGCHRALYHGDNDQGCKHTSHVTESHKCQVCDLILHASDAVVASPEILLTNSYQKIFFTWITSLVDIHNIQGSSRAPPAISLVA